MAKLQLKDLEDGQSAHLTAWQTVRKLAKTPGWTILTLSVAHTLRAKGSGARESKKKQKVSGDQGKTATFFQAAVIQDLLNQAKADKELAATLDQCVLCQIPIHKLVVSKENSSNTALSRILDTAIMPDISNGIIALTDLDSEFGRRLAGVLQVLTTCHR